MWVSKDRSNEVAVLYSIGEMPDQMSCSYNSLAATGLQVIQCESGPEGQP